MKAEQLETDVVLIGAGIMSATLGVLLRELDPALRITIVERLDSIAGESSDVWNNAGTGHSAFCELNYTPQLPDGSVDISKAIKIAESFEVSRQFWSFIVRQWRIEAPHMFINHVPHMSFVWNAENVAFLKKRHAALVKNPLFKGMEYSDNWNTLEQWMPLVMAGRDPGAEVAATRMELGTDVNFGALSRILFTHLVEQERIDMELKHEVHDLDYCDGKWELAVTALATGEKKKIRAGFVFIGAGGGALPLLEKSGIPEAKGYGGFPVSGQWLKCTNEDIIERHHAKVYGKAATGSPPMSVPHLDTRMVNGKKELLFGPYAGFTTKFLKNGSSWDLLRSLEFSNVAPMLSVGLHNFPLIKYLVQQDLQSVKDRMDALRAFIPNAVEDDWELVIAGQRVQIIKKDEQEGGILEFGTEVVTGANGSLAALLGASPGASTAVSIMLGLLQKCFSEKMHSPAWQKKLEEIFPAYAQSLSANEALCFESRRYTATSLHLPYFNPDGILV